MKKTGMPRFGLPDEDGDDDVNETYVVRRPSRTRTLPRSRSPAHARAPVRSAAPPLSASRLPRTGVRPVCFVVPVGAMAIAMAALR